MSWEEFELGELCKIGRGSSPRPISNSKYFDEGDIPWVKIADATDSSRVIYKTKQHVNSYGASFSRFLPSGSLILSASGTVGFPMILGVEGCIHDGWLYFDDFKNITKEFLYYKLIDLNKYYYSLSYGGANIQNINTEIVRKTKIKLPPLQTQKRIADILSAYDDLIENNLKRIKLLEQAAQNIYTEWFANLRFPGYENTPINEETGLPKGWVDSKYSNHFDLLTGKKDANHSTPDGDYPFFTCGKKIIKSPDFSFDCNAILLAGNGDFNVKYFRGKFQAYQRTYILSPFNSNELFLLFIHLSLNLKHLTHGSKGSVIKYLTKGMIEDFTFIFPNETILEKFNNLCENIFSQIETLEKQNQRLKSARDILLPRLMNRTIEV